MSSTQNVQLAENPADVRRTGTRVVQRTSLLARDLSDISNRRLLALRIPGFCETALCNHVANRVNNFEGKSVYENVPDIEKPVGMAIYEAYINPEMLKKYYEEAQTNLDKARDFFLPFGNPADKLRAMLDECWPGGCRLDRFHDRLMFAGVVRGFTEGSEAHPHQDVSHWEFPDSKAAQENLTQLAAVIYFSLPNAGGELELWDDSFDDEQEYNKAKVASGGGYGFDRKHVGRPAEVLSPMVGELIIFNGRRIHAVAKIEKGSRYTQSVFIGYRGDDKPLSTFS
jgi:2OG-Fe(II) oxygenase superfamily